MSCPRSWRGCSGFDAPDPQGEILALLEKKVLADKKATGRTGMELWQILVLGVVRLGLDADWDRMEHIANYDALVRQMLGVAAPPWGRGRQSVRPSNSARQRRAARRGAAQGNQRARGRRRTRGVRKKAVRPSRRLNSRWTPTCWKPTSIFPLT